MMSRKSLVMMVAVLLLVPAAAFANGGWMIDARGGLGIPMGDFKTSYKSGLLVGVEASKMMSPQFAIGVDGNYIKNGASDDYKTFLDANVGPGTDGEAKLMHYGAHAKYMMSSSSESKMTPYLVGGAGLYHIKESITNSGASVSGPSVNKFGIRGGVGLNIMMSPKMGLGFQADYNDIFTSGGSSQFVGISGGLHWMLPSSH